MNKKELTAILSLKDKLSPQLKGIQGRLKVFGDEIKRMAKVAFMALAAAVAAVSAALVKMVRDTVAYGVQLDKVVKQTGVAAEDFSKLAYAAEQEHASVEALTKVLPILSKYMEYARQGQVTYTREFDKMGISVVNASGKLKSTYEILLEMSDYYSTATNKTQALAIATTLLGRRGAELVPLLQLGRKGIEALGDEAEKLGIVMDSKTAAGMKVFDDNITKLKGTFRGIGIAITQELLPYLTVLSGEIGNLDFGRIRDEVQGAIESLVGFGAFMTKWGLGIKYVFDGVRFAVANVVQGISGFMSKLKIIFLEALTVMQTQIQNMFINIQALVDKAGVVLEKLGVNITEGFSTKLQEGIDKITESIQKSRAEIELESAMMTALAGEVESAKNKMLDTAKAIEKADSSYKRFTQKVKENSKALVEQSQAARQTMAAIEEIAESAEKAQTELGKMRAVIDTWVEGLDSIGTTVGKAVTTAMDGIASGTAKSFRDMLETGANFAESMKQMFRKLMFDILEEILRSQIRQALASLFTFGSGGGGGGFFGGLMGILGGFFGHKGGVISPNGVIADMQKFHNGGWPGLRNDEVPIVAQTGERILNRQEAAEYSRRGREDNPIYNITINAVDAQSFAMLVRRNPEAIIGVVGENMKRNGSLRGISRATA